MDLFNNSTATFSSDHTHRFTLCRFYDYTLPYIQFIGLNPSTANETKNDPTITRLCKFSQRLGYGGFYMTNLFTFVSADPKKLEHQLEMRDRYNYWLLDAAIKCKTKVFCWGAFKTYGRAEEVIQLFPDAMCFGKNADGSPKHPLYLKSNTELIKF